MDMTCGNGVKTLLLMVDGQVIGCAARSRTILSRLNAQDTDDSPPGDNGEVVV